MTDLISKLLIFFIVQSTLYACANTNRSMGGSSVTINSTPWGNVYIDGKEITQDGSEVPIFNYSLSEGEHLFEVKRKGFSSYKKVIYITNEEHNSFSAILTNIIQ